MLNLARSSLPLLLLLFAARGAAAQDGFALKGHLLFNSSDISAQRTDTLPSATGFGLGAEFVLPLGIGLGISGYTSGGVRDADLETTSLVVLTEANYFLKLLPLVSPYVGVHAGLGRYSRDESDDIRRPELRDGTTELGYQIGARLQLNSLLGLDAQFRRVSTSALREQGGGLERSQFLIGVTLF
ncbi:MAG: porin family protein, partial [Gemmatimonadota bacterium]|nr:porin family protein [Gemmatimonadota bacterium]